MYQDINMKDFKECDWKLMHGDVKKAKLMNAPDQRGKPVDLHLYVDLDHAGKLLTRCSCAGFFIFLNSAPIVWYSKHQSIIENSVFGAESVAMKQGMETL